jgi:hypothetical protein
MKKLFFITFFLILSSCNYAYAQKVEVDQSFVDDAAKAFALVVSQRDTIEKQEKQIQDLQKLAKELEKANQTPCTIAQEKVKQDLVFWTNQLTGGEKDKVVLKILNDVRKQGRRSIASQCGFQSQSDFMRWLDTASRLAPLLILLR